MKRTLPIKPDDIFEESLKQIPDFVIETFNELIKSKFNHSTNTARIFQKDVVGILKDKYNETSENIYEQKWLDIEPTFECVGWEVRYDKPAYYETYDAYFLFKMPSTKKRRVNE